MTQSTQNASYKRINPWSDHSIDTRFPKHISQLTTEQSETLLFRIRLDEVTDEIEQQRLNNPSFDTYQSRYLTHNDLLLERHQIIQQILKLDPQFQPPKDYIPYERKVSTKLRIPIELHPDYNFIGLIIGPRGLTQKRIEREYACKLYLRGRGSSCGHRVWDNEPLHVVVIADSESQLEKACAVVRKLLVPVEEDKKKQLCQLRDLGQFNTSLRNEPPGERLSVNHNSGSSSIDEEYERFMQELQTFR